MLLVGLDFGSTTSSAIVANGRVLKNCVTGRMEVGDLVEVFRAEPSFTPFAGDDLDEPRLAEMLDGWLAEAGVAPGEVRGGGAIVTGLAASAANAAVVARLVKSRLGEALIATADDPALESWVAFMGNCLALSRAEPEASFLNLDVGGGTTNVALGRNGEVGRVSCHWIGARHLRFEPGGYLLVGASTHGAELLDELGIGRRIGESLQPAEIERVVARYVRSLEELASREGDPILTFSGGVGELVYRMARGESTPPTTAYGDLGIDLARGIVSSPLLSRNLRTHVPETLGRATVYGLAVHNTEVSGSTIHLPRPAILPLADLPIVGRIGDSTSDAELAAIVELAGRGGCGACVQVVATLDTANAVRALGSRLASALSAARYAADRPLVLLVQSNAGKALGQYATRWGELPLSLIVVDEIPDRRAQFATLGRLADNVLPVSYYGMRSAFA